jgi:transcriptional regulator with XRE-family HTH domain
MEKRGHPIDGAKFRELRFAKGITVEQLSESSKVSDNTITEIESGVRTQVREKTLFALAKALGVTANDIIKTAPAAGSQATA